MGRIILYGCIFFSACAVSSAAQVAGPVVQARLVMATNSVHPGSTVKAAVVAKVPPDYHINAHKPSLDYLIPTEVKLLGTGQLSVEKVIYPKGAIEKFQFSDAPLSVYKGTVLVGVVLKLAQGMKPGTYTIKGKLGYQACNDHACLPPANVPLALTVRVVQRGVALQSTNADIFAKIHFD